MRRVGFVAAAALAVALLASCTSEGASPPRAGSADAAGPFDPAAGSSVLLPDAPRGEQAAGSLVVLVPGGGWTSADPTGLRGLADALVEAGHVVATITYRTSSDGAFFPTPAQDIACSAAYAAKVAEEGGVTFDEVVLVGHSAGAQLAAVVALQPRSVQPPDCPADRVDADRFVGLAGAYDVFSAQGQAVALYGAPPTGPQDPAWAAGDPLQLADRRPGLDVLLLHGTGDDVVPVTWTQRFAVALRDGGHEVLSDYPPGETHASIYQAEVAAPFILDWLAE